MADESKTCAAIAFITVSEAFERFCYYGIRTILALYLTNALQYGETSATVIYHTFISMLFFFPIVGAIISDSWLGKYRTIIWLYMIYIFGCIFITLASTKSEIVASQKVASFLGLFLIAVSSGGIKPCISAFGGDQFVLPQQAKDLIRFFSQFYFAINVGGVLATAIVPLLGEKIRCYGDDSCYSLAFGVTGLMVYVGVLIFFSGTSYYNIVEPEGNMLVKVTGCIGHAIKMKIQSTDVTKAHWLDHASDLYDQNLINDIKKGLKVLFVFIPLPVFWCLYEQQASRWTFQARRMNGALGELYQILPDQMQVLNPLMIMFLIVLFEYTIYPCMKMINFDHSLKRMLCGGCLAALSFLIAGYISKKIESGIIEKPSSNFCQLRIYNTMYCDLNITARKLNKGVSFVIKKLDFWTETKIPFCGTIKIEYKINGCLELSGAWELVEKGAVGYYFLKKKPIKFVDDIEVHHLGLPKIRFLIDYGSSSGKTSMLNFTGKYHGGKIVCQADNTSVFAVNPDDYVFKLGSLTDDHLHLDLGAVYVIMVGINESNYWVSKMGTVNDESHIHMLWQLPQYILMSAGEVMFAISGLEFAYSEAPPIMKSVLQACFLLTYAIGNVIVIIVSYYDMFENPSSYFFCFGGIMIVDMLIFSFIVLTYIYVEE